ncbi:M15 family metallopeptidase [Georgenia sp. 311]|uniref:M15 family metallopeptidase n=1 Tax=Georgenia sp. 311 TaxID=2585134 RepID=UPI0011124CB2|nr:M15 family metallopeptidase [Georgenia sp. 311]TNC17980.1 M15 family metallopeptidase [Georgenia sp. 311]
MGPRGPARGLAVVAATAALVAGTLAAAAAQDAGFFLDDSWDTSADHVFVYGRFTDDVLVGDWDGDGRDTVLVRRGDTFHVSNEPRGGPAERVFRYGRAGDVVLVGDWDGDGRDTLAVRRGAEYHLRDDLGPGPAGRVVVYGRAGDEVLVGDWDGDGADTLAVRRGATYFVRNSIGPGAADRAVVYGRAQDVTLAGDWDGDGDDSLAVRRGAQYLVRDAIAPGAADRTLVYGRPDDEVFVGDWDGDGTDTLGVRRLPPFRSAVVAVTAADIGSSWRPGCPVAPADLRTVVASHWDAEGRLRTGRVVVAAGLARDVATILEDLYRARFPVQRMVPVAQYGGSDAASMAANNTSAFNCRAVTGGTSFSEHAYGRAIDVNPLVNPYVVGSTVLPPAGAPYADRSHHAPGTIHPGDEVVRAFAARGWAWGGDWRSPKDYQHFSTTGR